MTLRFEGNGSGEFADIQQPNVSGFECTGNCKPHWRIAANGSVYTTYEYRQKIRCAVVDELSRVCHQLKRIDPNVTFLNWQGVLYREFGTVLPLNVAHGQVSYEIPFDAVEGGKGEDFGRGGART